MDDDEHAAASTVELLTQWGAKAEACHDAYTALARLHAQAYDLLLVDYRMPEFTGLDLVRQIREESVLTPIIMISGYEATHDRVAMDGLAVSAVLRKPLSPEVLSEAVRSCLAAR